MKRFISAVTLTSVLFATASSASAGGWQYQSAYPVNYRQDDNQVVKKIVVGGVLVGLGFLAGRLTAPQPEPQPYNFGQPPIHPQFPQGYQPGFGQQSFYRPPQMGYQPGFQQTYYRGPQDYYGRRY